jgi:hypothetical protein
MGTHGDALARTGGDQLIIGSRVMLFNLTKWSDARSE